MKRRTKVVLTLCGVIALMLVATVLFKNGVANQLVGGIDPPWHPW